MPVIAVLVSCKKCGSEIRSDWHFCPSCGDKIVCTGKYKELCVKKR
ncbi:zinc-ribbon domain-containing protein [Chloroflexota bacterium]